MGGSEAAASVAQQPGAGAAAGARSDGEGLSRWAVAAPFLAVLAGLLGQLTVGRAIIWTPDSFGFVYPGMLMASGADAAGQLSGRNIGYPWLASLVLPLGGLRALVTVPSVASAAGLAALLLGLRGALRNAFAFCGAGLLLVLAAYGSDSFVLYAQTINGDSLFGSLLAVSLGLFLAAWRRAGAARAGLMVAGAAASYAAYLIKPNGVLTIGVCIVALGVIAIRKPKALLHPAVLAGLFALAGLALVAQTQQARLTDKAAAFGPRVLFCGHLDLVGPDLGSATPERRVLSKLLDDVRKGPRWTVLGFNPDLCFYKQPVTDAIHAAAAAEGMSDSGWMTRRVTVSILRHPQVYVLDVARQVGFFLGHPNVETDLLASSKMSDWDWDRMASYRPLIRAPRIELDRQLVSWMARRHPLLAQLGKHVVGLVIRTLPAMALISLVLAAWRIGRRRRIAGPLELALVGTSAFLAAAVLSVALSFTFDIARYAASFAPLTYLWWFLALSYLLAAGWDAMGMTGSPVSVRFRLAADGVEFIARWPDVRGRVPRPDQALAKARRTARAAAAGWRACSPWIFRVAIAAPFAAILLYLSMQLVFGSRVLWGADSAGFAYTGMMLASGDDITGNLGGRNIGYTLFSAPLLRWGGFPALVIGQAALASVGLAGLALALRQIVRPALLFGGLALLLVATVVASDSFVIYVQTVNGEALFGAALSAAMALFVMAWRRRGAARAGFLLGALAAAYVTWLVKPNAVLTIPLCGAAFLGVALLDRRAVLKPALLAGLAALAVFAGATYAFQSKAQPKAYDFGTRVLYCGHIDVVLPELGAAPQQRQLAALLDAARRAPPLGWTAMGYNADRCFYSQPMADAIHAAATAEGLTDKAWMAKQFRSGVVHHPLIYAGEVWRQIVQYVRHPDPEIDVTMSSRMPDDGWAQLHKYVRLVGLPQSAFDIDARSWFVVHHPVLARAGKATIGVISKSLPWVTAAATLTALAGLFLRWRRGQDLAPEMVVLASSAFMMAVVLTTAISFTFDVGRYASSIAPPAFAWWLCCLAYLAIALWRPAASAWKQRRLPINPLG